MSPDSTPLTPAILEERLKKIIDYVHDCERRVSKGEIMDLQGLDKNVIEICDAIADTPKELAQPLEMHMTTLIAGLESLSKVLKLQQMESSGHG